MDYSRRRLLQVTGASLALATSGLAGCLHDDSAAGDAPAYTDWIRTHEDNFGFVRFRVDELEEFEDDGESEEMTEAEQADPMLALPIFSTFALFAVAKFSQYGLETTGENQTYEIEGSTLTDMLVLEGTTVMAGDIDTGTVEDVVLESTTGAELERTDEVGDFGIYTADSDDVDPIAIGGDGIVVPSDDSDAPGEALRNTLETFSDGTDRAVDDEDDFAWMVSEAGDGLIAIGGYGQEDDDDGTQDEYEALFGMEGLVASLEYESNEITSNFAGIVGDADADDLRDTLGASADESSVDIDDGRVTATATWQE